MTSILLASLPLQLMCHLIIPEAPSVDDTNFVNLQSLPQVRSTKFLDDATTLSLGSLSLKVVCQLIITNNPNITENGAIVDGKKMLEAQPPPGISPRGDLTSMETTSVKPTNDYYVAFPEDRVAYKIYEQDGTWDEAKNRCIADGASLAIADSVRKIEHINSLKSSSDKWVHVGIRKLIGNGEWVGVDNDFPLAFIPWIGSNPDGAGNCAGISKTEIGLVNYSCGWKDAWYVCEIPISRKLNEEKYHEDVLTSQ